MKFKIGEEVCIEAIGKITEVTTMEKYDPQQEKIVEVLRYTLKFNYTSGNKGFAVAEESLLERPVGT